MSESLLPCASRSSTTIGGPSQASLEASPCEHRQHLVTINTLPDDVLLEIFQFYVNRWHTLVHVCQRWRHVVFASPCRLNLYLQYSGKRPMSDMMDIWPALPVVIMTSDRSDLSWNNVASALKSEHRHRICEIDLSSIQTSQWERLAAAMQKPLPELTRLCLWVQDGTVTPSSDSFSFLGGSAPLLRRLWLSNCPFPGLPKLLLSANQLVCLYICRIPDSGYISPQDLGAALSVMSRLEYIYFSFQSPLYPASRPPPPLTRSVLPALIFLEFRGVHEYSEDLLAQFEAPLLYTIQITLFIVPDFVLPQLHRHRLIIHANRSRHATGQL